MGRMGRTVRTKVTWLASVLLVAGGTAAWGTDARPKAQDGLPAVSSAPPSQAPARAGGWDGRGMRSGYRSLTAEPLKAPKIVGEGRYEAIQGEAEATPGVLPPSTLPTYTQRTWESGVYEGPGKRTRLGHGPRAGKEGSAQRDLSGTRHRGKPPGLTSSNRGRRYRNQ
ncbi:MAG: hypothetical protein QNK05_25340 [Myxococcota bacterium]|nr:hypothetical protein [Myxococcota bacterium]